MEAKANASHAAGNSQLNVLDLVSRDLLAEIPAQVTEYFDVID
jgi:hypothetical protein